MNDDEREDRGEELQEPSPLEGKDFIAAVGGWERFSSMMALFIHFLHVLLITVNEIYYVRNAEETLSSTQRTAYLVFVIISDIFYFCVVSPFYMWAWRYPDPPEESIAHRVIGVGVNLVLCDIPIFFIEVDIVWTVGFAVFIQGASFVWSCISMLFSVIRVWTYGLAKVAKGRHSTPAPRPVVASARSDTQHLQPINFSNSAGTPAPLNITPHFTNMASPEPLI